MSLVILEEFIGAASATHSLANTVASGDSFAYAYAGNNGALFSMEPDGSPGSFCGAASVATSPGANAVGTGVFGASFAETGATQIVTTTSDMLAYYVAHIRGANCDLSDADADVEVIPIGPDPEDPCDGGAAIDAIATINAIGAGSVVVYSAFGDNNPECEGPVSLGVGAGGAGKVVKASVTTSSKPYELGIYITESNYETIAVSASTGSLFVDSKWGVSASVISPDADSSDSNQVTYIVDNICEDSNIGLIVNSLSNSIISRNRIARMAVDGCQLNDLSYSQFNENDISRNDEYGVYSDNCLFVQYMGNKVVGNSQTTNNTWDGMHFATDCNDNSISSSTIHEDITGNRHRYGIRINDATSNRNVVIGNDLKYASASGNLSDAGTATTSTANST